MFREYYKERNVVREERRMRTEDAPRALLMEQLGAVQFTASPYRRPIVGWMSDLDAMTPQDARDFYRRWYTPSNAVVVVAGLSFDPTFRPSTSIKNPRWPPPKCTCSWSTTSR